MNVLKEPGRRVRGNVYKINSVAQPTYLKKAGRSKDEKKKNC